MAAPPDSDVLMARGVHYSYDGSPALQGASLSVRTGEIVAVTGPRGSGKTTLLRCLSGQLAPRDGEIWFGSVPLHNLGQGARERLRRDRFGWVGSAPQLVPELTAWENAALPLLLCGEGHRAARRAAREWLDRLDVGGCARKRPTALLQSERQRVAIARALAHSPAILFADEPTAPLHETERTQVLRTLTSAARSHDITVVLSTHDPAVTAQAAAEAPGEGPGRAVIDRLLTLVDGRTGVQLEDDAAPAAPRPGDGDGDDDGGGGGARRDGTADGGDGDGSNGSDSEGAACSLSV